MISFKEYESNNYDFYRFVRLVIDLIIEPNNISVPYDVEMGILYKHWLLDEFDENSVLSPYEQSEQYILNSDLLLNDLLAVNEG